MAVSVSGTIIARSPTLLLKSWGERPSVRSHLGTLFDKAVPSPSSVLRTQTRLVVVLYNVGKASCVVDACISGGHNLKASEFSFADSGVTAALDAKCPPRLTNESSLALDGFGASCFFSGQLGLDVFVRRRARRCFSALGVGFLSHRWRCVLRVCSCSLHKLATFQRMARHGATRQQEFSGQARILTFIVMSRDDMDFVGRAA